MNLLEPLLDQLVGKKLASYCLHRADKGCDETEFDWVAPSEEGDWYGLGGLLGC